MTRRTSFCPLLVIMLAFGLCLMCVLHAQDPIAKGTQPGIYIGGMRVQPSVIEAAQKKGKHLSLKRVSQTLDSQLVASLSATRVFQIVERKRKSDLELEQGYASTAADVNDKDAAQTGKMAGAKYAFLPRIDGFEDMVDVKDYKAIERSSMRRRVYLSVTASIIDTSTGRLLPDVPSAQLSLEEIVENSTKKDVESQGSDAILVELAKKAANTLCQDTISMLRPAKVLSITGQQILINRGTPSGFIEGMQVEFLAYEEVKDEDSSETFRNEIPVGRGVIIRADQKQSYAIKSGEDLGVAKGCMVKLVRPVIGVAAPLPVSAPGGSFPEAPRRVPREPAPGTPGSSEAPLNFDTDATIEVPPQLPQQQTTPGATTPAPPPDIKIIAPQNDDPPANTQQGQ